jgi:hypothetical protein
MDIVLFLLCVASEHLVCNWLFSFLLIDLPCLAVLCMHVYMYLIAWTKSALRLDERKLACELSPYLPRYTHYLPSLTEGWKSQSYCTLDAFVMDR